MNNTYTIGSLNPEYGWTMTSRCDLPTAKRVIEQETNNGAMKFHIVFWSINGDAMEYSKDELLSL